MKKLLLLTVMICALGVAAGPAFAVSLSLSPANQWVQPGGDVSVDLVVGGLGDFAAPSLGGFFMDISYDPTILQLINVFFDLFLGDPLAVDPVTSEPAPEADFFADIDNISGVVTLWGFSFLQDYELNALQPDSFILATLNFMANHVLGSSPINFVPPSDPDYFGPELTDGLGTSVYALEPTNGAVVNVPEPATLLLLGPGLVGLAGLRRKFKRG